MLNQVAAHAEDGAVSVWDWVGWDSSPGGLLTYNLENNIDDRANE